MMDESSDSRVEASTTTNNIGNSHAQRDAWIGNTFRADVQNFNFTGGLTSLPPELQHRLLPNQALFATGTPEQKRAAALNLLYYDGFNAKREQLSLASTSAESYAWIEKTDFPKWLVRQDDKPCWIFGKPGSGKSTLMKYLAENKSTRERLDSASSKKWHIIYFFFDYRGGSGYRNNIKGLLRFFISQIITQIPSVTDRLHNLFRGSNEGSISSYSDELCQLIANESIHICAFVDGLDEYQGDPWDIYTLIDDLRRKAGAKICLASRPESSLTTISAKLAGTEIFVHHNNRSAVKACIDFKLEKLQPIHRRLADCIPPKLRWKIVDRAEGVILWASLAVDDVVKEFIACDDPSSMNFEEVLDSLPLELETLYDRILDKISPSMASEAALMLHLLGQYEVAVAKADPYDVAQDCPLEVLLQACSFIQDICLDIPRSKSKQAVEPSESGIMASLGDVVDVIGKQDKGYRLDWQPPFPELTGCKQIRLIHKSFSKYITKSQWIESHLDSGMKRSFPNSIWRRLGLYIMTNYPQLAELSNDVSDKLQPLFNAHSHVPSQLFAAFGDTPLNVLEAIDITWKGWELYSLLCKFCTTYVYDFEHDQSTDLKSVFNELSCPRDAYRAPLVHLLECYKCKMVAQHPGFLLSIRLMKLYSEGHIDLCCTLLHGDVQGLEQKILVHENETRSSLASSLYDIMVFAQSEYLLLLQDENLIGIADLLTRLGARFEPRHLCGVQHWTSPDILKRAVSHAKLTHQTNNPFRDHDPDCPRQSQEASILHHWVDITIIDRLGESMLSSALTLIGPDINSDFREEGSIFHAIIEIPSRIEQQKKEYTSEIFSEICVKFVIAARHSLPSRTPSKHGLASSYTKKLRKKYQLSLFTIIDSSRREEVRTLKLAEAALEEAETRGAWGPQLEEFTKSFREKHSFSM